jgi:CheY-like chemotaxis protein
VPATRPIEILLVEDSPPDARLTIEALRDARILNQINVLTDGEQALNFLRKLPPYEEAPRPDLVLLDLDLPKIDGREVLQEMKSDANLMDIPVVVLTSSKNQADVTAAYKQQASCYIKKPVDPDQYFIAIRSLKELWFNVVTLPTAITAEK